MMCLIEKLTENMEALNSSGWLRRLSALRTMAALGFAVRKLARHAKVGLGLVSCLVQCNTDRALCATSRHSP